MRRLFLLGLLALRAWGYSIGTAFSEPCHERLTAEAFDAVRSQLEFTEGATLRQPALEQTYGVTPGSEPERFALMSLLIGVHAPDTEGRSLLELENTRLIHVAPFDQYGHALRNADDDGVDGELRALDGIRARLRALLAEVRVELARQPAEQRRRVPYYFDGYGLLEIEVWSPAYVLGRAVHLMQDAFSHALRSDDLHRIRHLLNYADAITPRYDERRDGLRHASSLDACGEETAPLTMAARTASAELIIDVLGAQGDGDAEIARWLEQETGCDFDDAYCDSPWAIVARRDPTVPLLGCSTSGDGVNLLIAAWLALRSYRGTRPRGSRG